MANQKPDSEKKTGRIVGRRYRYTGDYQVVAALGPNGRRGKQLIYLGQWIRPVNEAGEYKTIVLWLRILTAVAAVAAVCAMWIHPADMTHRWYVPILVAGLFPLLYQAMGAMTLPAEPSYMERQQYDKSFVRVGHSAAFALTLVCISALGCVIYWILVTVSEVEGSVPYSLKDGAFAALLVVTGLAELAAYRFFRKLRTETYDNDAYHP